MTATADTVELLGEVDSGCTMAINSFHQLKDYPMGKALSELLEKFKQTHVEIREKASELLHAQGQPDKKPNPMASAMSWITTEMKMMIHDDNSQIAKLMMDGCNMGIQSIGEKMSKYSGASEESVKLAQKLIRAEEEFMSKVKEFL